MRWETGPQAGLRAAGESEGVARATPEIGGAPHHIHPGAVVGLQHARLSEGGGAPRGVAVASVRAGVPDRLTGPVEQVQVAVELV